MTNEGKINWMRVLYLVTAMCKLTVTKYQWLSYIRLTAIIKQSISKFAAVAQDTTPRDGCKGTKTTTEIIICVIGNNQYFSFFLRTTLYGVEWGINRRIEDVNYFWIHVSLVKKSAQPFSTKQFESKKYEIMC